ncbi:MAG: DUF790 family protein [Candidatus Hodarchaeales archaeon]|jgi:predicted nuclease of restriction endonuclease-like RecB superfamily
MQIILKKRKFSDKGLKFTPMFLTSHQELLDTIAELINSYEINLGTRNTDFYDDEHFISKFNDIRILKGINFILTKFYYSYTSTEYDSQISSADMRINLYDYYIQNNLSFILPKNKDLFFQQFSEERKYSIQDVKKNLFLDHSLFKVLSRKNGIKDENESPLPKEIVLLYNQETIRVILNRSFWFEFSFNNDLIDGTKFKNLIFLTKRLGLYYESIRLDDNNVKIKILGPQELVGRSAKYGRKLNVLLLKNLNFFVNNHLRVDLLINFYGQKREVSIDFSLVEDLLNIHENELKDLEEAFDSKVEEKFNNIYKALDKKWEITREPVIIENGIIMIPDFKLKYKNLVIFVEIVGFWTEKYLNHKIRKVRLLENKYENLILFIDENLNFPSTKLKTFHYGKEMHVSSFIHYIKDKYEKPIIKQTLKELKSRKEELITAINELLEKNDVVSFDRLLSIIPDFVDLEILKELVNTDFFHNANNNFIIASYSQIILKFSAILSIKDKLIEVSRKGLVWEFDNLLQSFPILDINIEQRELRIAMKILGCNWKIKNLVEEFVIFPEKWVTINLTNPVLNF